jgi:ribonuclease D
MTLPPPVLVENERDLAALVRRLQNEPLIAVDTESNGLYAYYERVCLMQLSTRTEDIIVDPLRVDLTPLGAIFADPNTQKVFHAAEYDIMCLKRDYGFSFANVFDTMLSARVIGRKTIGLADILHDLFGVQADKRYQRADWTQRPIPREQLHYAQQDTHYLPALRDWMMEQLESNGSIEEAQELFDAMCAVQPMERHFDPEGYWRINAARDLTRRQMAILRELYLMRDRVARQRNKPPFKIIGDSSLVDIARVEPETLRDLERISGIGRYHVDSLGAGILQAIQRGRAARLPTRPDPTPKVEPDVLARYNALHDWRKGIATARGVESDVIISKEALWALARNAPQSEADLDNIPGLGPWRKVRYGAEIIKVLHNLRTL